MLSRIVTITFFCIFASSLYSAQKPKEGDIDLRDFYYRERKVKARTDAIVDTQIKILDKSLKNIDDTEQKVKFMLRLAELYQEKGRSVYFDEVESYEKELDRYRKQGKKGKEPELSQKKSDEVIDKAINLYNDIITNKTYKKYLKKDFVYFQLGLSFHGLGKVKEAFDNFQKLIQDFPKSEFVADAHLYV